MKAPYLAGLIIVVVWATACGGGGGSPTSATPQIAQVAGVYTVTATTMSITGGECVASMLQSSIGTSQASASGTLQVSQSANAVNAIYTDSGDASTTTYNGTAGLFGVALNVTGCSGCNLMGLTCPSGARRDLLFQTGGVNLTAIGGQLTGTEATSFAIVVAGTSSGVGVVTINNRLSAVRR